MCSGEIQQPGQHPYGATAQNIAPRIGPPAILLAYSSTAGTAGPPSHASPALGQVNEHGLLWQHMPSRVVLNTAGLGVQPLCGKAHLASAAAAGSGQRHGRTG